MMPGTTGTSTPSASHLVDEAEVGVGVVEVLGDGRIGAGPHLGGKGLQVGLGRARLRVDLGVGRHLDVEVVAGLGADEGHQVAGVVELAARAIAAGQVAAQGHQALDAHGLERGQLLAHRRPGWRRCRRNARPRAMPSARMSRTVLKVPSCVEPPAPKVTEQNSGFSAYSCWRTRAQLVDAFGRLGRKEFEAEGQTTPVVSFSPWASPARSWPDVPASILSDVCVAQIKNSRLPSPPAIGLSNQRGHRQARAPRRPRAGAARRPRTAPGRSRCRPCRPGRAAARTAA